MNLPSNAGGMQNAAQSNGSARVCGVQTMPAFLHPEAGVAPFEFRSLTLDDTQQGMDSLEAGVRARDDIAASNGLDRHGREAALRSAIEAARQEALQTGEREGSRAVRAELEARMSTSLLQERQHVVDAVSQFSVARDRYFAEVEQEVVKLSLAIAARVLHREAQIDPLLLTGVVRVALEKMADRSGVVLRVAGPDVEAWERVFHGVEASERPRVAEDARLQRGECVLETKMGTVELGVQVQLEEIEKGFFDLLNHRPVA